MGLEKKNKEARDKAADRVNQHGEEAPTVRTPNMDTHKVPATKQSVITPKGKAKGETPST